MLPTERFAHRHDVEHPTKTSGGQFEKLPVARRERMEILFRFDFDLLRKLSKSCDFLAGFSDDGASVREGIAMARTVA